MPAGSTYTPIATTTLGSNQSSVTFSSISASYTDLVIVANAACTAVGQWIALRFNGDSGSNYSDTVLEGTGSSALSAREANMNRAQFVFQLGTDSTFGTVIYNVQNYSNTTTFKTTLGRWNYAGSGTGAGVALWRNTAAITSVTLVSSGTMTTGSNFTLYGIASA